MKMQNSRKMETSTEPNMKVYLAGPMSNIPFFNFPAFFKAEELLKSQGHEVFSPARHDVETYGHFWKECPNGTHKELDSLGRHVPTYKEVLKVDLNWILDNAEAIALMPGWEKSKGVAAEKALAECLGLKELYLG